MARSSFLKRILYVLKLIALVRHMRTGKKQTFWHDYGLLVYIVLMLCHYVIPRDLSRSSWLMVSRP